MVAALTLSNLKKTYDDGHVALNGIDMTVEQGDFFALLGKNGAGKSTTIGIISSLVNKSAGSVQVFDADIDVDFAKAKSYIGIVPQEINFSVFETADQIVMNQAGYYGICRKIARQRADHYLNQLGLSGKKDVPTKSLSGGMKRRLMIDRALVNEPKLLILDEPTAGVDIEIRRSMWDYLAEINEKGTTIILTTHYLEEAESLCRNIAIIESGELIENTSTKTLLAQLKQETYVLDLIDPLDKLPDRLARSDAQIWTLKNDMTLEVVVPKSLGINPFFETLTNNNIRVQSMRNKTNRLEQLFLEMTDHASKSNGIKSNGRGNNAR
ncbi:ABC transporter ATP-binding protein [Candidatus Spongiihabitans sp.]|uniref:ABC transporter ATP-binding protein n=1 Tax=Candidatus Spongiihabitans sp. TaxID=3101308 RepID=UPI003C704D45